MNIKGCYFLIVILLSPTICLAEDSGEVELSYSRTAQAYSVSGKVSDSAGPLTFYAEYTYGKSNGYDGIPQHVTEDYGEIGLDWDRKITDSNTSLWLDYKSSRDKLYETKDTFIGAGAKYSFINEPTKELSVSCGIVNHHETDIEDVRRYSCRPKYEDTAVRFLVFYKPNVENTNDYLASIDLRIKLSKYLTAFYKARYISTEDLFLPREGVTISISF